MTIDVNVYDSEKLVHAICTGLVTKEELFHFQDSIWSAGQHTGYDCIFDMLKADFCKIRYSDLLEYARSAAMLDYGHPLTKLAVVVSTSQQKILTEFYQAGLKLSSPSTREIKITYSLDEAKDWIELVAS